MADELKSIHDRLKSIKENLTKLSYSRRTETLLQAKLEESTNLLNRFNACNTQIEGLIKKKQIGSQTLINIQYYCDSIKALYLQIELFCSKSYNSETAEGIESENIMASFDFKTATSLLPKMDGKEDVTKDLIDSIELYSSSLNAEGNAMLIKFVLKSRLNSSAKLRLSSSYASCKLLIDDMRNHLLTKQSSTTIHKELVNSRQNGSSIETYGSKIEQLFVELTLSQADGDEDKYRTLCPINEKLAIRSFTDGLRNRQLSTVLLGRNYSSLKDTIRAAKDEEPSCSRREPEASVYFGQRASSGKRPFHSNNRGHHTTGRPTYFNTQYRRGMGTNQRYASYNRGNSTPQRGHPNRGQGTRIFSRGSRARFATYQAIRYANHDSESAANPSENNNTSNIDEVQFFRS